MLHTFGSSCREFSDKLSLTYYVEFHHETFLDCTKKEIDSSGVNKYIFDRMEMRNKKK